MEIILLTVFGAIVFGFFLIFLSALSAKKRRIGPTTPTQDRKLDFERFERICCNLLYELKLEIDEIHRDGLQGLNIIARNPSPITGGTILVQCHFRNSSNTVPTPEIIEFSNVLVQERATKGIFITNGRFTDDLSSIAELAPIEFIDGNRLNELVEKHHL